MKLEERNDKILPLPLPLSLPLSLPLPVVGQRPNLTKGNHDPPNPNTLQDARVSPTDNRLMRIILKDLLGKVVLHLRVVTQHLEVSGL